MTMTMRFVLTIEVSRLHCVAAQLTSSFQSRMKNVVSSKIVSSTYSGMPNKINKELIFDQLTISTSTLIRACTFIRQTRVD